MTQSRGEVVAVSEAQARHYCALLAIDPDEMAEDPSNRSGMYITIPRWRVEAGNLLRTKAALKSLGVG